MSGAWTGVLEYRDYQTDGRVELPTWLKITSDGDGLRFEYVYDDGPTKVVTDSERVVIDAAQQTYRVTSKTGEAGEVASVSGLAALRSGRGTLTLTGTGVENDHAVEVRTTLKIGRNLLEILRETHLPGEEFKFRHRYVFTRAVAPSVASAATR